LVDCALSGLACGFLFGAGSSAGWGSSKRVEATPRVNSAAASTFPTFILLALPASPLERRAWTDVSLPNKVGNSDPLLWSNRQRQHCRPILPRRQQGLLGRWPRRLRRPTCRPLSCRPRANRGRTAGKPCTRFLSTLFVKGPFPSAFSRSGAEILGLARLFSPPRHGPLNRFPRRSGLELQKPRLGASFRRWVKLPARPRGDPRREGRTYSALSR